MGVIQRIFGRPAAPAAVAEAAPPSREATIPVRAGYEAGIPVGGTAAHASAGMGWDERRQLLEQLYGAYIGCPWANASVSAISRTITAGGLVVATEEDLPEGAKPTAPAAVRRLREFLAFCNPSQDVVQLLRGAIADIQVFGDGYLEVVWIGSQPAALYSLDAPSMTVVADEHGTVEGYVQNLDGLRKATFEPHEVIHVSIDDLRGGLYGTSPTQMALVPIVIWLFASATLREIWRKGDPPNVHVDLPSATSAIEMDRWLARYQVSNVGVRNIGNPTLTKGGGKVTELGQRGLSDLLQTRKDARDEIIATYGVPPRKLGIAEAGSLGGSGAEEGADRTFRVNTCRPLAALLLEKLNYSITKMGFGLDDWRLRFTEVDWRDSAVVEEIAEARVRSGRWTLNRAREEIGEPPVDGGDVPVLIPANRTVLRWIDVDAGPIIAGPAPAPTSAPGPKAKELRGPAEDAHALDESWRRAYQARRRSALKEL